MTQYDRSVEALGACSHRAARSEVHRTAWQCALASCHGSRSLRDSRVAAFLRRKDAGFMKSGDTYLIRVKRLAARVRQMVYDGHQVPALYSRFFTPFPVVRAAVWFQLLKVSRALPEACPCTQRAEVEAFYDRVSVPAPDVPESSLRRFDGLKSFAIPNVKVTWEDFSGCSASYQHTRKQGGRGARLKGKNFPTPNSFDGLRQMRQPTRPLARTGFAVPGKVVTGTRDAKVIAIPELGCKARILTKNDEALVAQGHAFRRELFRLLTTFKHVVTSEGLKDPDLEELTFEGARRGAVYFSGDLSAATDYLSRQVIDRVCTALNVDPLTVYVDTVDGKPCLRGTSMGLPPSWPILSICHYAIAGEVDPRHNFRIKGDDIVAFWTPQQIEEYISKMLEIGFVVNRTKSFTSQFFATFCEVDYRMVGRGRLLRMGSLPLRSFVRGIPLTSDVWLKAVHRGFKLKNLHQMCRRFCRRYIQAFKSKGLNPYAPIQAGGGDLPPRKLERLVDNTTSSIIRGLHNGLPVPPPQTQFTGSYMERFSRTLESVRWSVHGSPELTAKVNTTVGMACSSLFTLDCIEGTSRPLPEVTPYRKAKQVARTRAIQARLSPGPYPTSYATAYDVVRRLEVVDSGLLQNFYRPYLRQHADPASITTQFRVTK